MTHPQFPEDYNDMWREMEISQLGEHPPEVDELLDAFRRTFINGQVRYSRFQLSPAPHLEFYLTRLDENQFIDRFLDRDEVAAVMGARIRSVVRPAPISPFHLVADLCWTMWTGGAYERWRGSADDLERLVRPGVGAIVGEWSEPDSFGRPAIVSTDIPWAEWHRDVAWDRSWLGADVRHAQVWILSATDTD